MNNPNSLKHINSINLNLYSVIMAIPFFGSGVSEEEELIHNRVPLVQEVVSESDVEEESLEELLESESSFVGRLLQELVGVYSRMSNNSGVLPTQRSRRVRNNSRITNNNGPPSSPPQQKTTTPTLPDILCCHAKDLHPIPNENDDATIETQLNNRPISNPRPTTTSLFGNASTDDDDLNSELSLDVKMNIDFCYQRIGRDLRQIADQFETTTSRHNRRCQPEGNHSNTEFSLKFDLDFAITLAIPATLVGLGLAYLKKSA